MIPPIQYHACEYLPRGGVSGGWFGKNAGETLGGPVGGQTVVLDLENHKQLERRLPDPGAERQPVSTRLRSPMLNSRKSEELEYLDDNFRRLVSKKFDFEGKLLKFDVERDHFQSVWSRIDFEKFSFGGFETNSRIVNYIMRHMYINNVKLAIKRKIKS